jgi:hypothetical protein
MKNLPIIANLTTRDGFQKNIEIYTLENILYCPKMSKIVVAQNYSGEFNEINRYTFYLENFDIFTSKNKKVYIIAYYNED